MLISFLLPWIVIVPAIGVLLIAFVFYKRQVAASVISCSAVGLSFILSLIAFFSLLQLPTDARVVDHDYYTWIESGIFRAAFGLLLDPLSGIMILVVTGVGFLIHLYSVGYMHGDRDYSRYFAYLNLFIFSMLILVLANNYVLMFVGWELVGLCSYLLIGFWFEKKSAADAGKKAFIVNRIGDFGFLIGIFLVFTAVDSVHFRDVFARAGAIGPAVITAACIWLFCGAVGKSAQFPLHVWLPDAMEGPTPVSALIHAATMVTAGVYMVARSAALYAMSETALLVVLITGTFTALFAASMALVQYDIKRVLAYSTVSQLGYMFIGLGAGAFAAGIFHLMTHAFFKALLFLSAGSVMHAMGGETDFRKMGGLKGPLKSTFRWFLVGGLALAGILPFAGFFSKDSILLGAFLSEHYGKLFWAIGTVVAFMTAYYTFRIIYRTFITPPADPHTTEHAHESPSIMLIPLAILAVFSLIGGWVGIPGFSVFEHFLEPVFPETHHTISFSTEIVLMSLALAAGLAGIAVARTFHYKKTELAEQIATAHPLFSKLHHILLRKWYVDELYDALFVRPIYFLSNKIFFRAIDVNVIDGLVNDTAFFLRGVSRLLRRMQTGDARAYAAAILIGTLALIVYFVWTVNG